MPTSSSSPHTQPSLLEEERTTNHPTGTYLLHLSTSAKSIQTIEDISLPKNLQLIPRSTAGPRDEFEQTTTPNASIGLPTTSIRPVVSFYHCLIICDRVFEAFYSSCISFLLLPSSSSIVSPEAPRQSSALHNSIISFIPSSNIFLISSRSLSSSILTSILIQFVKPYNTRSVRAHLPALRQPPHPPT